VGTFKPALAAAVVIALGAQPHALATAFSVAIQRGSVTVFRTTPDNADRQARECEVHGLVGCGEYIARGSATEFAADCLDAKQTEHSVARALRFWARRARAKGPAWRVYTRTERGGFPFTCRFAIERVR
jgi:hypothetical protein